MNADDFVGGHSILALERFMDETRHMIIFDVLSWKSPVGEKGERLRLFLSDVGYAKAQASERRGEIKIRKHAPSLRGISFLTGKSGVTKVIGGITMSRVTELEKALTTLFRKGTEVGYTETEIDEFLENIDYHALLQAVWNKAETVYAYRADGKNALSLDYRSAELFKQRATLLYEDVGDSYIGAVFAARSMELWLLEDMGFAVVAKFSVNAGEGEYVTEYRVYKGSDWADSEISLDLEDLVAELAALCDPYYEHEQPIYEL